MIVAAQFNDTSTSSGQAKARSNFGRVVSHPSTLQLSPQGRANIDMPNDAQRLCLVRHLIEAGLSHCVLMSQDIHSKHRMVRITAADFLQTSMVSLTLALK